MQVLFDSVKVLVASGKFARCLRVPRNRPRYPFV